MTSPHTAQLPDSIADLPSKGEGTAIIQFMQDTVRRSTFDELRETADRLASGLRNNTASEEPVVLFASPSTESIAAILGVLRAGRVLVPLDTQLPDEDLQGVLENCGASIALTTRQHARRLRALESKSELKTYRLGGDSEDETADWTELMGEPLKEPVAAEPESVALLFYTSGTTGLPKGVPLTHRNLLFQLETLASSSLIRPEDRVLLPLPLHHVYPFVIGLLAPLAFGLPVLLPAGLTGPALLQAMREGEATVVIGVPRLYNAFYQGITERLCASLPGRLFFKLGRTLGRNSALAAQLWFKPLRRKIAPRLRLLASGGSPLDAELASNLEALGWPVAIGYGLTETSPLLTIKKPGEGNFNSVGRAIDQVQLRTDPRALSSEEDEAHEDGDDRGELLAKGPNVFSGYHRNEEATSEAFSAEGWFRTGDVARIDDNGFVFLGGRVSTRIALQGGENINPDTLEDRYAAARGVEEIGILEHENRLAALVRPTDELLRDNDAEEAAQAVREALKQIGERLPSYQRISRVEICTQPLPRTRLGKLRRHKLAEYFAEARQKETDADTERASKPVAIEDMAASDQALLENERARALWELLCERYADQPLKPDAHLQLDLGIDSMEWVELSMAIEEQTDVVVDEERFGQANRVRDLLDIVASTEEAVGEKRGRPMEDPESHLHENELKWTRPRGRFRYAAALTLFLPLKLLFRGWFTVTVEGLENLPEPPFILVPNHGSYLDAPALAAALGARRSRGLFWAGYTGIMFANALAREISRLAQVVPIDPKRGPVSSLATTAAVLNRGAPLVWFPEGGRSKDGALQPFKPGIGLFLKHRDEVVIPVRISGSHDAWPPGQTWPKRGPIHVWIGHPIEAHKLRHAAESDEPRSIAEALRNEYLNQTKHASDA